MTDQWTETAGTPAPRLSPKLLRNRCPPCLGQPVPLSSYPLSSVRTSYAGNATLQPCLSAEDLAPVVFPSPCNIERHAATWHAWDAAVSRVCDSCLRPMAHLRDLCSLGLIRRGGYFVAIPVEPSLRSSRLVAGRSPSTDPSLLCR